MEIENKVTLIALVFMFILGILVTILFNHYFLEKDNSSINLSKNMIENISGANLSCNNLTLINTSECLSNELKTFFFYNLSNIGKELNDYDYKELGMVCHQATEWYLERIKQLNNSFYTKDIIIDSGENSSHEFVVISDKTGYCNLDQLNYKCYTFNE
jgi:hypothetical protein